MAVTCSHGHLINHAVAEQALKFRDEYKPHTVLHLGDFLDETAFMGKALGADSREASTDMTADLARGLGFVERLRPDVLFLGNHDTRAFDLSDHPREIIALAARSVVREIEEVARKLKADLVPYTGVRDRASWRMLGDTAFGHGIFYSMRAGEDHALMLGCPVVFGHTHRLEVQASRSHGGYPAYNIGLLGDINKMEYASRRRATTMWQNGWAYGEYGEGASPWCSVNLHRCKVPLKEIPRVR